MDLRTLVLGLSVFCATFAAGWWLNIGKMVGGLGVLQQRQVAVAAAPTPVTTGQSQTTNRPQVVIAVPRTKLPPTTPIPQAEAPAAATSAYAEDLPSQAQPEKSATPRSSIRIRRH